MSNENTKPSFEQQAAAAVQSAVLKLLAGGEWLSIGYSERMKLDANFLADVWGLVDREQLKRKLAERLESELIDRMVNHMASELATDIKQILSVKERREALRELARRHMTSVMNAGKEE
jgi:hypothetical protein